MAETVALSDTDLIRLHMLAVRVAREWRCELSVAIDRIERAVTELEREAPSALEGYAAKLLHHGSMREAVFSSPVFRDLAWTMLLDLFVNESKGQRVSVSSLTIASRGPATTALRHIYALIEEGLIVRSNDDADGRRSWLSLTPETEAALVGLLTRMRG